MGKTRLCARLDSAPCWAEGHDILTEPRWSLLPNKKGISQTMGKNKERGRGRMHVGAEPMPVGARKAGCEKLLGSPRVTAHSEEKRSGTKARPEIAAAGCALLYRH